MARPEEVTIVTKGFRDDQTYVIRVQCKRCAEVFRMQDLHAGCPACDFLGGAEIVYVLKEEKDDGEKSVVDGK